MNKRKIDFIKRELFKNNHGVKVVTDKAISEVILNSRDGFSLTQLKKINKKFLIKISLITAESILNASKTYDRIVEEKILLID